MNQPNSLVSHYARIRANVTATHSIDIEAPPEVIFPYIEHLGGENGWYSYDRLLPGRKIKPLRSDGQHLRVGDKVDFFTVTAVEVNRTVELKAGRAPGLDDLTATFCLEPLERQRTRLSAVTTFAYLGKRGEVYWACIKPFDRLLQRRMLRTIKRLAEQSRN